jgi:hypothetical protein
MILLSSIAVSLLVAAETAAVVAGRGMPKSFYSKSKL